MTSKSTQKKSSKEVDVKQRLHDAALSVFSARGYAGASVAGIVEAAGVTKPMMYYYFGDKDALWCTLLAEAEDEISGFEKSLNLTTFDLKEAFEAVWKSAVEFLSVRRMYADLLLTLETKDPLRRFRLGVTSVCAKLVQAAVESKLLPKSAEKDGTAKALASAVVSDAICGVLGMPTESVRLRNLVLTGLERQK